jgi:hypothetical protein
MCKFYTIFAVLFLAACTITHDRVIQTHKLVAIPLELTTHLGEKHDFVRGDEMQFLLSLGSDAYIYMYYIDAEKNITQILPSKNQPSNHYSSGYFLTLPEYKDGYRFIVSEPFGKEDIWVIASDQPIDVDMSNKSIEEIKQKIKEHSKREYGEYVFNILTMP